MKIKRFEVGPLMTNCYLVSCETTGESVLVDPGGLSSELKASLHNTRLHAVLLTHGHFDHIAGLNDVVEMTGAPVYIHELDAPMLTNPTLNGSYMIGADITTIQATSMFSHDETIQWGESSLKVLHTPGHSEGSVSFVGGDEFVISGDTLFRLSVGRWDLAGGDYHTLMESIRLSYLPLPDTMDMYPGHGEPSTIGFEKQHNQFITGEMT